MPIPRISARRAVAVALVLRRVVEEADTERGRRLREREEYYARMDRERERKKREQVPPWSSSSYWRLARSNRAWARVDENQEFVLGLLLARCDDTGRITFARADLLGLYGLERDDFDDEVFQLALDRLIAGGWIAREPSKGGPNTYRLALPRKRLRVRL